MWKYDVVARHHGEAANVFGLINEQSTKLNEETENENDTSTNQEPGGSHS